MDRTGPQYLSCLVYVWSYSLFLTVEICLLCRVDIFCGCFRMGRAMAIRSQFLEERIPSPSSARSLFWAICVLGALSLQYNVCGSPSCRRKADPPLKHGPYPQISFTWHGKSTHTAQSGARRR